MKKREIIPTHEFYDRIEHSIAFDLISLREKGAYDPLHYHRHSYYEIFFFLKGGGKHDIDFETFVVESNTLHFVFPGLVHMLRWALNSNGFIILFSREFYQLGLYNFDSLYELPFLNNNTPKPVLKLPDNLVDNFRLFFLRIQQENESLNKDKEELLRAQLNLLLLDLKRLFIQQHERIMPAASVPSELVKKFRICVEKNFMHLHKPGEYADLLNVSTGHLNDVVKDAVGVPSTDVINERLLLEIKRMLFHSDESINEIAHVLNFDDISYFSRFFKTHAGESPKDFRVRIREKYL